MRADDEFLGLPVNRAEHIAILCICHARIRQANQSSDFLPIAMIRAAVSRFSVARDSCLCCQYERTIPKNTHE
jgi:hypothetical protein